MTHFCPKNCQNFFFKKRRTTFVEHHKEMSGPNFSSRAPVTFSNSAGRREKMKCLKTTKMQKIALFDRKTVYFKICTLLL